MPTAGGCSLFQSQDCGLKSVCVWAGVVGGNANLYVSLFLFFYLLLLFLSFHVWSLFSDMLLLLLFSINPCLIHLLLFLLLYRILCFKFFSHWNCGYVQLLNPNVWREELRRWLRAFDGVIKGMFCFPFVDPDPLFVSILCSCENCFICNLLIWNI